MNYTTINVTEKKELNNLYNHSALTIEGLAEDSINDFVEWLEEKNAITSENLTVYIISGKTMNNIYQLTNNNRYPDDLTIISVMGIDQMKIATQRFEIGGRWFDDIVDNNAMREAK